MGKFEEKAREYIETCGSPQDRAYIVALSVALDNSMARVDELISAARDLGNGVDKIVQQFSK